MIAVGDETDSAVAETGVGVAAGVFGWPEQAARIIRTGTRAHTGSPIICDLLSFCTVIGARSYIPNEEPDLLSLVRDWASIPSNLIEGCSRQWPVDINHFVLELEPFRQDVDGGLRNQ